ncbi:MAG: hypothetical protein DSO09_03190 [Candidatus Methanomethylicota archaeon]|jgi:hypothetical protein|uniref:DUF2117 domain-containing protein n=1 Tax=Thermoproteota archaeon TaxID=2056631 RepID=A0A520KE04_9CREN|nr:MAG: DUF2117 domain-containing protein [Candidatus Verstraetearchaeota archaeon]TDA38863.1 MAG: hypothetical protein DSO09_03190 [Candidatus Verstraetearchaeota archaeon]
MYLILYDIEGKKDPHGIRIRLVRRLKKLEAFQLQKSSWIIEKIDDKLLKLIEEFREAGGSIKILEWLPRSLSEIIGKIRKIALVITSVEIISEKWYEKISNLLREKNIKYITIPAGREVGKFFLKNVDKSLSRILDEVSLMDIDGIIILNNGRSTESGIIYIAQAISNTKILKNLTNFPLIHIERIGRKDGSIIIWNGGNNELVSIIKEMTGLNVIKPSIELMNISKMGSREIRKIHCAMPGDKIIVNDICIGICLSDQVYLIAENGRIIDIMGGKLNKKAANKISFDSISKVIIKTIR